MNNERTTGHIFVTYSLLFFILGELFPQSIIVLIGAYVGLFLGGLWVGSVIREG